MWSRVYPSRREHNGRRRGTPPTGGYPGEAKGGAVAVLWASTMTQAIGYAVDLVTDLAPVLGPILALLLFPLVVSALRSLVRG